MCIIYSLSMLSGLAGDTNWERALVEQVVDTCDDLRAENAKIIHERDPDRLVSSARSSRREIQTGW